ncbi:MAG TPA: FAD-dependent oxidoreductase [Noviherbaspirillum sp.]|jgi:2-polyprenyl-6-methoxyphenol hydroxylase-like FAD-dependent oxidoreductase|uniref:FAD-dependent oxidoreductase n=1 Tax=Noviherbaspirillum sp. TaxID=1926288 RepID=UPI002F91DF35
MSSLHEVVVVGAGPTGLSLGVALASRGHGVVLVDAQGEGRNTSRAAVVHARTLEVLQPYGVADRLVEEGVQSSRFTVRDRDRVLLAIDFDALPSPYRYALMVSQARTEQILLERLLALGGKVLRPRRLAALCQDAHGVAASLDDGATLRGHYLVGADGMHSTVREAAGIAFDGGQYAESFLLADVQMTCSLPPDEVVLYFSPAGLVVVAPLPGGLHRIVATMENAPETPGVDDLQRLLDARGPARDRAVIRNVTWGSRFRVHHRLARRYRAGRILLAGDAAHVHSPAGGQGMNTGIQDAVLLGELLGRVLDGADASLLDNYECQRRAAARHVLQLAGRLTRFAVMQAAWRPWRNAGLSVLASLPAFRRRLALQLAGLDSRR